MGQTGGCNWRRQRDLTTGARTVLAVQAMGVVMAEGQRTEGQRTEGQREGVMDWVMD
jgi:hypothetical protein